MLPEPIDEMAKEVVVAWLVVALTPVKFCRVEEPVERRLPTVTKLEKTGSPPKVPERVPPLVALKVEPIVVEPVMKVLPTLEMEKSVEVANEVVEEPMVKSCVVVVGKELVGVAKRDM